MFYVLEKKWTGLFTFVLEYIMSIIGDTTKDAVCVSGVPSVDFLGLDIKPVLIIHKIIPENVIKNDKKNNHTSSSYIENVDYVVKKKVYFNSQIG